MNTPALSQASDDYERIEKAIKFLETNFSAQPGLKEIADHIGLSEFHFQRLFSRWVGISPKRFLQFLTKEYAKNLLEDSINEPGDARMFKQGEYSALVAKSHERILPVCRDSKET